MTAVFSSLVLSTFFSPDPFYLHSNKPSAEFIYFLFNVHIACEQDAAYHVIVMTTHPFGMAMHQRLSRARAAIAWCHMIIMCKPHGVNLIGVTEFRNAMSASPRKRSMCTRPFPPFGGGVWGRDYHMAGNFRGSQFSRFSQLTGDPRKLNLRNKKPAHAR